MKGSRIAFIGVFLFALLARALYLSGFRHNPFFDFNVPYLDPYTFQKCAEAFLDGDLLARHPVGNQFSPLYKYVVGTLFLLFGRSLPPVWIFQFFVGALSTALLFAVARRLFGRTAGLLCALFYTLYGPNLCFEGTLLRVSLTQFFAIASCLFALKSLEEGRVRHFVLLGVSLSLMIQCRPNTILVFLLLLPLLLRSRMPRLPSRLLAFFSVFLLVSLPLFIQAVVVNGKFVFYDDNGPKVAFFSNLPKYRGYGWDLKLEKKWHDMDSRAKSYPAVALSLLQRFFREPLAYLLLYLRKLYYFFCNYESTLNLDYTFYAKYSFLLRWPLSNVTLFFGLALAGLLFSSGRVRPLLVPLAFLGGTALTNILFYNLSRFRLLAVPFLMIFASFGALRFFKGLLKRDIKVLFIPPVVGLAVFLFRTPAGIKNDVYSLITLEAWIGTAYAYPEGREDLERAEEHYLRSWNLSAETGNANNYAFHFLKDLYEKQVHKYSKEGELEKAARAGEKLLRFDWENPHAYLRLAKVLRALRKPEEAAILAMEAAALGPAVRAEVLSELASITLQDLGNRNAAGFFCSQLLDLPVQDMGEEGRRLGGEYRGMRREAARTVAEKRKKAEDLSKDDPERALQIYREITDLDFGDLHAHLGLSAIYFDRKEPSKSREEILISLAIRPQSIDLHRQISILYDGPLQDPWKAYAHLQRYLRITRTGEQREMRAYLEKLRYEIMTARLTP